MYLLKFSRFDDDEMVGVGIELREFVSKSRDIFGRDSEEIDRTILGMAHYGNKIHGVDLPTETELREQLSERLRGISEAVLTMPKSI